jgi:hypothetical protein
VPHEGRVVLVGDGEDYSVVHLRTHEIMRLPPGVWELVYSPDGFGAAINRADHVSEPVMLDTALQKRLRRNGLDDFTIRFTDPGTGKVRVTPWPRRLCDFKELKLATFHSVLKLPQQVEAYQTSVPRQGLRLYWTASAFYTILRMTGFLELPSKWVNESKGRWAKTLGSIGFDSGQHVLHSRVCKNELSYEVKERGITKSFPAVGISTVCLVLQLARWQLDSGRHGGLRNAASQQACHVFLEGLLQSVRNSGQLWLIEPRRHERVDVPMARARSEACHCLGGSP